MAEAQENFQNDIDAIQQIPIITNLLDVVCQTTGMGFAAVARVTEDRWITCSSRDDLGFGLKPGDELQVKTTICDEIRESGKAVIIDHVAEDPHFCTHHTPAMYGIQSYISVPIFRKDGSFFGTLCAIDPKPNKLSTPAVTGMFTLFSDLISFHLNAVDKLKDSESQLVEERSLHKILEQNEEKLNIIIDASDLGTYELNFKTKETQLSDKYLAILGYPEGTKMKHDQIIKHLHPDDLASREKAYEIAFRIGKLQYETRIIRNDKSLAWIEGRGKLFYDTDGSPLYMIGTIRDITAEKTFSDQLEKKVTERTQQLKENNEALEKMNTELQSFAYISSHDLQEPLRKIQAFASWIIENEQKQLSETGKDYFRRMQNAGQRMQTLINDLLTYSRTSVSERKFESASLNAIIEDIKSGLQEEIAQKQAVIDAPGLCVVTVIPFQFHQLLYNLISNSLKFANPDQPLKITIGCKTAKGKQLNEVLSPDADYCHISVSDNGIGFDQKYSEKIFGLFQRLNGKMDYPGTGIGLSIVKKIIENHHGHITATSMPGKGARFDVYIPG